MTPLRQLARTRCCVLGNLVLLAVTTACGGDTGTGPTQRSVLSLTSDASPLVVPDSLTIQVLRDGMPESADRFEWFSFEPQVVEVLRPGWVRGRSAGRATVAVRDEAGNGAFLRIMTVEPLEKQRWDRICPDGWVSADCGEPNLAIVTDETGEPVSPGDAIRFRYPAGKVGGTAPGNQAHTFLSTDRLFVGFSWKGSRDFEGHDSGINKILFIRSNGCAESLHFIPIWRGTTSPPGQITVAPQRSDAQWAHLQSNVDGSAVSDDEWHGIELLMEHEGGGDWRVRWWVDGTLRGDHAGVPSACTFLDNVNISPTWGGTGDTKTRDDFYWFGDIVLAAP